MLLCLLRVIAICIIMKVSKQGGRGFCLVSSSCSCWFGSQQTVVVSNVAIGATHWADALNSCRQSIRRHTVYSSLSRIDTNTQTMSGLSLCFQLWVTSQVESRGSGPIFCLKAYSEAMDSAKSLNSTHLNFFYFILFQEGKRKWGGEGYHLFWFVFLLFFLFF